MAMISNIVLARALYEANCNSNEEQQLRKLSLQASLGFQGICEKYLFLSLFLIYVQKFLSFLLSFFFSKVDNFLHNEF